MPKKSRPEKTSTKIDAKRPRRKHDVPPVQATWWDERFEALGLTRTQLDRELGLYENYIGRIFTGQRKASLSDAVFLATRLRLPISVVIRKLGYELPELSVPVIGRVNEFGRVILVLPEQQSQAPAPANMEPGTVALCVDTAHTALAVYDGQILYYAPSKVVRPDAFGRLSVVEMADQGAPVVGVLDRARMGQGRVVLLGGKEVMESDQIVSATPIRWKFAS